MLPNACPKPTESRFSRKEQRHADIAANLRSVYRLVDRRDHRACRVCGRPSNPYAVGLLERGHRHHLIFRSRGGEDSTQNLATICGRCHDEIHAKGTLRLAGDADLRDPLTNKLNGVRVERLYEEGWRVEKWV